MWIFPVQTDAADRAGFTFPEILVAMLILCLTVYAATSALITILRYEDSGLRAMRTALALQQTACRHFLPSDALPDSDTPAAGYFVYPPSSVFVDRWAIYTLTPVDDSDSMPAKLALSKGST